MPRRSGSSSFTSDPSTLSEDEPSSADGTPVLTPALTVLYHREARRIGDTALLREAAAGKEVALSRTTPLFAAAGSLAGPSEPLGDPRLSRQPLRIVPVPTGLRLIVEKGRLRYRGVEVQSSCEVSHEALRTGGVLELSGAVALVLHLSQEARHEEEESFGLLGRSHSMQAVRADLRRIAAVDAPVLIRGETGTGKELAARALHAAGPRRERPFVAVNLGAIPPSLAAAELFGAEKGAYTGASGRQLGYFQQARGGTLFLDEIGEAPPEVQVLLLRAIESGEIRAVGAGAAQEIKVRLIAATDADLESLIQKKTFRAPLLHRLSTCELRLPALRERREDVGRLVLHFLRAECHAQGRPYLLDRRDAETAPWLPLRLLSKLAAYDWPGNVRQLRNVVRQLVLASDGALSLALPPSLRAELGETPPLPARAPEAVARRRPSEISESELLAALTSHQWDLKATAEALAIARPSLYMLLEKAPHLRPDHKLSTTELARSYRQFDGDLDAMAAQLHISRSALRRRLRETPPE